MSKKLLILILIIPLTSGMGCIHAAYNTVIWDNPEAVSTHGSGINAKAILGDGGLFVIPYAMNIEYSFKKNQTLMIDGGYREINFGYKVAFHQNSNIRTSTGINFFYNDIMEDAGPLVRGLEIPLSAGIDLSNLIMWLSLKPGFAIISGDNEAGNGSTGLISLETGMGYFNPKGFNLRLAINIPFYFKNNISPAAYFGLLIGYNFYFWGNK